MIRHNRLSVIPMMRAAALTGISRARLRAFHPGNRGMHIAMMLEEVQVSPCLLMEVMRGAFPDANKAGVPGTSFCLDLQVLIDQFPGSLYAKAKEQNLLAVYSGSSVPILWLYWHSLLA